MKPPSVERRSRVLYGAYIQSLEYHTITADSLASYRSYVSRQWRSWRYHLFIVLFLNILSFSNSPWSIIPWLATSVYCLALTKSPWNILQGEETFDVLYRTYSPWSILQRLATFVNCCAKDLMHCIALTNRPWSILQWLATFVYCLAPTKSAWNILSGEETFDARNRVSKQSLKHPAMRGNIDTLYYVQCKQSLEHPSMTLKKVIESNWHWTIRVLYAA